MIDNKPKEYDAVLGVQLQVPADGIVLGGIKGVKKRLAQDPIKPKLAALKEALKFGDAGLDLIIEALRHQPPQVKQLAYTLLCQHPDEKAKQSIEKCNQYQFFQCLDALEGHKSEVVWVRFCSNGKKFISVSKDATIKVWNLTTGKVIQNIETDISKHRVATKYDKMHITIALSSDETTICCVTDHNPNIEVWNLDTGSKIYTLKGHSDGENKQAGALAISADGQILFSSSGDRCIKVWDVQTGNLLGSFKVEVAINSFCLSPDGKTLFSGTCEKVILWNWQKGEVIKTLKLNPVEYNSYFNWINYLTISLDGRFLAGMSLRTIKVWDLETGQEIHSSSHEESTFTAIDLSQDGQTLVISPREKPIEVWDLKTRQLINNLELYPTQVIALALNPDGKTLVTGSEDPIIRLWDLHKKQLNNTLSQRRHLHRLWLSQDGNILVYGSFVNSFKIYNSLVKENRIQRIYSLPKAGNLPCAAISPDSKTLISRSSYGCLSIWDLQTGKETGSLPVDLHQINDILISPDSKTLVFGDEEIQLWDITTKKLIRTFSSNPISVTCAAISLDGNILVTGMSNNSIIVWDWQTGKEIRSLVGHIKPVNSIAISSDGNLLVSGSDDKTVILWNLQTGEQVHVFEEHSAKVYSVAINSYGQVVSSASEDGNMKIWSIETGELVDTCEGLLCFVDAVKVSPDGQAICSGRDKHGDTSMCFYVSKIFSDISRASV